MTQEEKILERIRKLLALARDGAATEAEASLAMERAQALLCEHNLSLAEIENGGRAGLIVLEFLRTDRQQWRRILANSMGRLYFCQYFYSTRGAEDTHSFIGQKHNVEVARLMFDYVHATIERLAHEHGIEHNRNPGYVASFKAGIVGRIAHRILEQLQQACTSGLEVDGGGTLPALVSLYDRANEAVRETMLSQPGFSTVKAVMSISDEAGFRDGVLAGADVGLDRQVSAKQAPRLQMKGNG